MRPPDRGDIMARTRTRTRTRTALSALLAAGVVLLAGCAGRATTSGGDSGDAGAVGSGVAADSIGGGGDCRFTDGPPPPAPVLVPLPADAVLVGATRCLFENQLVTGDGEWLMKLEQHATADLAALATALRLPDQLARAIQPCTAIGYVPIIITVTDQHGNQITPRLPAATCGGPLKAASDAIAALNWSTVTTAKVHQTRTELEISSDCPGQYKHMIAIAAAGPAPAPGALVGAPILPPGPLQVCRYDLDPSSSVTMANSTEIAQGRLATASTLDSQAAAGLLAAVAAAPAAAACGQPPAPFALLFVQGAPSRNVAVELGGCYRALVEADSSRLRQLDTRTVAILTP
jgi:hypothetical protein